MSTVKHCLKVGSVLYHRVTTWIVFSMHELFAVVMQIMTVLAQQQRHDVVPPPNTLQRIRMGWKVEGIKCLTLTLETVVCVPSPIEVSFGLLLTMMAISPLL